METLREEVPTEVKCTYCGSDALYRYGYTSVKKQRYLCLLCGKQFTLGNKKMLLNHKPQCPACGMIMHLYKKERGFLRFRCSKYPTCRTYKKINTGGEI